MMVYNETCDTCKNWGPDSGIRGMCIACTEKRLRELESIVAQLPKCWRLKDPTCQCGSPMQPVEQPGLQPDWKCPACSEYVCSDLARGELVQDVPVVRPMKLFDTEGTGYDVGYPSLKCDATGLPAYRDPSSFANSREAAEKLRERK